MGPNPAATFEILARRATSVTELDGAFGREVRAHGFTAYAAGYVPTAETEAAETARVPFLLIDWPRAWLELYARQGFAREDAVVAEARHATAPFTWRELQARRPGASARIFAAASTFGWNDGLLVPVPAPESGDDGPGRAGVVSLAAPDLAGLDAGRRAHVACVARTAFRRAEALARAQTRPFSLTARERDVLRLVAQGCDDAEIGTALGLTRTTAHTYVERAKRRLGAATRAQAVATALRHDLLERQEGA